MQVIEKATGDWTTVTESVEQEWTAEHRTHTLSVRFDEWSESILLPVCKVNSREFMGVDAGALICLCFSAGIHTEASGDAVFDALHGKRFWAIQYEFSEVAGACCWNEILVPTEGEVDKWERKPVELFREMDFAQFFDE